MEEELGYLEVLEKHLGSADPIADWIVWRLRQEYWVFSGIHLEFFKDMSPDCFHIIPILHDAVIHGILKLENALKFFLEKMQRKVRSANCSLKPRMEDQFP